MAGSVILTPESVDISTAASLISYGKFAGAGGNAAANERGYMVGAAGAVLASDAVASLRFQLPATVPTGNMSLRTRCQTTGTVGQIYKYTVSDAAVAAGADPSAATLTAEAQVSQTLPATPSGKYMINDTLLSASPAANGVVVVAVTFNATGWTLNQLLSTQFFLVWD